jgi:2-dehydro-3-deoxyphosphogluconate aldolase/(4S)-4-hydroxy-2-oxoglutarate aldolase
MKHQKLEKLLESVVVAVVRRVPRDKVLSVISALVEGGVTGIEMTMDSDDVLSVIAEAQKRFGDRAVIGAGTVLDASQ